MKKIFNLLKTYAKHCKYSVLIIESYILGKNKACLEISNDGC